MSKLTLALLALFALTQGTGAQERPKVLIIGDSISIGYTPGVAAKLKNVAEVQRIPGNAQDTRNGLLKIDAWLGDTKWSVIHFNWGLWDLVDGGKAVPLDEYKSNLEKLVRRLKKTGATLVFATTTPVPAMNARKRKDTDVMAYNESARAIMREHGVDVDDLYTAAQPNLSTWQLPNDVHFTAAGSAGLAEAVATAIRPLLPNATR